MKVFRWPGGALSSVTGSVATLGVFDGVHVGHQSIIRQVTADAGKRGLSSAVITFDRHPQAVLGGPPEPCITSLEHRLRLFDALDVEICMVVSFTPEVAQMEAEEFARAVLRDILRVRLLIVGFDCRFGRARRGDVALLRRMSGELGLETRVVEPVRVDGEVVSSTAVRRAVMEGDLERAHKLLGRPFSLLGTVVSGSGRGREIGFPTANIDVHNELLPQEGVYAGLLFADGASLPAVVSVGRRETFFADANAPLLVEAHLLDISIELYGRGVEVQFVQYIRPQKRFPSPEALARQIGADCAETRRILMRQ
jgi:riboflavin kinase/FMN adenylyltransferase